MTHCHDMKEGQIYRCVKCGLELKVVKGCTECCGADHHGEEAGFKCCGEDLILK